MPDKLGCAVIGLGMMGERHARIWAELPQTRLVSVYDILPGKALELTSRLDGQACSGLEDTVTDPEVHIISVCTDDQSHLEPCIAAARAGKHVLVEKPLATKCADADAIIAACEDAGVKLMVGHVVRFDPRYAVARQAIADGAVGEVVQVYARRNNIVASARQPALKHQHQILRQYRKLL